MMLYTIGHSNLSFDEFAGLLRRYQVALVVDVRSEPYSRYTPHFNKAEVECALRDAGFSYRYAGAVLGGKPRDEALHSHLGTPDYDRIAATPAFGRALEYLCELARQQVVAILCSEGDPMRCHREKLLARQLRARGVEVRHILSDGTLAGAPAQGALL